MAKRGKAEATIVIRREEVVGGGHHGGAWKVAYADFVTAMMAFFLLMWLLNATTEQQRRGIAAYFSPMASVENGFSGQGLIPGGVSPLDKGTSLVNHGTGSPPSQTPASPVLVQPTQTDADTDGAAGSADDHEDDDQPAGPAKAARPAGREAGGSPGAGPVALAAAEDAALKGAAERIRRMVAADPALADVAGQMAIDVTPEGLRIQIMDREGQPMFGRGSAAPNARAAALLRKVAPFLAGLPEPVTVGGYTDAAPAPPGTASNWTLSSGRADAARDLLASSGLPEDRIAAVTGYADRHLLLPADPLAGANRRIVLTLLRRRPLPAAAGGAGVPAVRSPGG